MVFRSAVCPAHIGRERETAVLEDAISSLRSAGRGRLSLVAGEAGVGKSRLVAEALSRAGSAGLTSLEGQCTQEGASPYGVFVTALRRRTRNLDQRSLTDLFDGPAALSAALLPEVVQAVGLPTAAPAAEDLFAAVWQLLARLARPTGGLLVLEDLHWADQDSLNLLAYLARELEDLPLWILGTYRADEVHRRHPLTAVLTTLDRERRFDDISLAPLDRELVRKMLSAIFDGTEVGDEFCDVILERTGGNPFFVEELAKMLVERGDIYHQGDDWQRRDLADIQMPRSVRETLLATARSMDPSSFEILKTAALAADDFDLAVLTIATGLEAEHVDAAVEEGLRRQVLAERRDGHGVRYAFRHALGREAFADELVGPARRRAHRAVAEAMVRVHATDLDAVATGLADHYAAAGDDEAAVEFALRAARRATAAFAGEEADRRFDQALGMMSANDERRLEVLLEASGSTETTDVSRMRVAFATEARRLAAARGDRVSEAQALGTLEKERWLAGDGPTGIALLREALALVHGMDDFQEAWTLRSLTRVLMLGDHLDEAAELLPSAIELAQRSGNLPALSGLYGTQMMMQHYGPEFRQSYAASVEAARMAGDLRAEFNVSDNAAYGALWSGALGESRRSFHRSMELVAQLAPADRYAHAGYAWLLSLTGDYDEASSLARPLTDGHPVPTCIVALTALTEVAQRRADPEAATYVNQLWDLAQGTSEKQRAMPALSARARQTLLEQGVDAAIPFFESAAVNTVNSRLMGSHWPFAPDLARALAREGRAAELADWVARIDAITEHDANDHNIASRMLCRAHLLAAQSQVAAARDAFQEAIARYRAMPCPAREAEALLGLSDVDWRSGSADSGRTAAGQASDVAERIGAKLLVDEALKAVERSQAQPVLATILFTDIVRSTELAASLGDREWRELLARHHAIVRRELARTNGREVDTAGDGFLVAFGTPAQAIRCARAAIAALDAVGIEIRAGVHTGECQESGGKLTGLTVHIASRVSQRAETSEVLVSGTVKELLAGSGIAFDDKGVHELKGVPGEWHLYAAQPSP